MRLLLLWLIGCTLTAGCGKKAAVVNPPPAEDIQPVGDSDRIYYDDTAVFPDSGRYTIRELETWRDVWTRATQGQASAPPLPAIDFSRYMPLVVSAGRMKPGDQIHVDSVGKKSGRAVAIVRTTVDCHPFPAKAYPFEIVRIRRTDPPVTFIERRATSGDCS